MIGSGGNINKTFKLTGKSQDKPLSYKYLKAQFDKLNALTLRTTYCRISFKY